MPIRSPVVYLFLVACGLLASLSARAAQFGDLEYTDHGDYIEITGSDSSISGDVVLPDEIDGKPVTVIGDSAFASRTGITSIVFPSGLERIEQYAFRSSGIVSLDFPSSLLFIGDWAFYNCDFVTNLTFPDALTAIGKYAFSLMDSLAEVTIPASVESLEGNPFSHCDNLTTISVDAESSHFAVVEDVLYNRDQDLLIAYPLGKPELEFTVLEGVIILGESAFAGSDYLERVTFSNSLTTIGRLAFYGCSKIESFSIGKNLSSIGWSAFGYNSGLQSIEVDPDHLTFQSVDGVLFSKDMMELITYPIGRARNEYVSYVIPEKVKYIADSAFSGASLLRYVEFPESLESLGFGTFRSTSLLQIRIPGSVREIPHSVFDGCRSLERVVLEEGVETISSAFRECRSLSNVILPASITSISSSAFTYTQSGVSPRSTNFYFLGSLPALTGHVWGVAISNRNPTVFHFAEYEAGFEQVLGVFFQLLTNMGPYSRVKEWLLIQGLDYDESLDSPSYPGGPPLRLPYALNLTPDSGELPRLEPVSGSMLKYDVYLGREDIEYTVEVSNDLKIWRSSGYTMSPQGEEGYYRVEIDPDGQDQTYLRVQVQENLGN
ncbi:MAG: leucine-rich repeat domain-containing protein [Verrucomicrobiota bacterium]